MTTSTTPSTTNLQTVSAGYPKSFTLAAPPNTDIYTSPKHGYRFNSPIIYHKLSPSKFSKARITIKLNWTLQFDQGGLILVLPAHGTDRPDGMSASVKEGHPRWIKAGIEAKDGSAHLSVVARETYADWSLTPAAKFDGRVSVATVEFEKSGNALKVFVIEGETKRMIRQIQWVFIDAVEDVWLGVYAARPDPLKEAGGKDLEVEFEEFKIVES
jgi:regulation of enolase protein 1 (concanavalin A-like superfamily)